MAFSLGHYDLGSFTGGYVSAECPCGNPFRFPVGVTSRIENDVIHAELAPVEVEAHWRVHVRLFHKGSDGMPVEPPVRFAA